MFGEVVRGLDGLVGTQDLVSLRVGRGGDFDGLPGGAEQFQGVAEAVNVLPVTLPARASPDAGKQAMRPASVRVVSAVGKERSLRFPVL